ncbi:structural cement protein Gp24 [Agrobacterium larrymoorei]|uniref:structural cement protein Gp24 n=1 Tax=Agrobacterium larrymoorei TaxID=160699 RepID=UPI0030C1D8F4
MPDMQSTFNATHARWVEGMVLNSEPCVVVSREVETVAGIGFGKIAQRGTGDHQIKVSSASPVYLGITVLDPSKFGDTYAQYDTAAVMIKGVIVVQASVAVNDGDPVYFVPATGVLTNVSTSNQQIPNAQWETTTSGAGLAAVRLG